MIGSVFVRFYFSRYFYPSVLNSRKYTYFQKDVYSPTLSPYFSDKYTKNVIHVGSGKFSHRHFKFHTSFNFFDNFYDFSFLQYNNTHIVKELIFYILKLRFLNNKDKIFYSYKYLFPPFKHNKL